MFFLGPSVKGFPVSNYCIPNALKSPLITVKQLRMQICIGYVCFSGTLNQVRYVSARANLLYPTFPRDEILHPHERVMPLSLIFLTLAWDARVGDKQQKYPCE